MAVRSDAKTMFDLYSDTESAKTIKELRDVVDSLSARLRTGGLHSQHAASDVQVFSCAGFSSVLLCRYVERVRGVVDTSNATMVNSPEKQDVS